MEFCGWVYLEDFIIVCDPYSLSSVVDGGLKSGAYGLLGASAIHSSFHHYFLIFSLKISLKSDFVAH